MDQKTVQDGREEKGCGTLLSKRRYGLAWACAICAVPIASLLLAVVLLRGPSPSATVLEKPYEHQIAEQMARLNASSAQERASAAESLGYLRAYAAADALALRLNDTSAEVRREAVLALGWCGNRTHVESLIGVLADEDWTVRRGAWVALTNITGMEFPFDACAPLETRQSQAEAWHTWWRCVPENSSAADVLALLADVEGATDIAAGKPVSASSTHKGPPNVLTDTKAGGTYWQTKDVDFPQSCTIDLDAEHQVACVVVEQFAEGLRATEYSIAVSSDGNCFEEIERRQDPPSLRVWFTFDPRPARYVRFSVYAGETPAYPTTLRRVHVFSKPPLDDSTAWRAECCLRALGSLGGKDADQPVKRILLPYLSHDAASPAVSSMVQAGLRSLGRIRNPDSVSLLIRFLDSPRWARYAADALGELADAEPRLAAMAEKALISAYPNYARDVAFGEPLLIPFDDYPRGASPAEQMDGAPATVRSLAALRRYSTSGADRMYETPYAIAAALARLPLRDEKNLAALAEIAPRLLANVPSDFDSGVLYEPESYQRVTAYLLERSDRRELARNAAFQALGQTIEHPVPEPWASMAIHRFGDVSNAISWLPTVCRDEHDVPGLVKLLEHPNGWARINAAKALMFMDKEMTSTSRAALTIRRLLKASRPEADYGYFGGFCFENTSDFFYSAGQDEYDDPSPRWREAFVRALGQMGGKSDAQLLVNLLNDDRNSPGVRHAAALALNDLGSPEALEALSKAKDDHPLHSVRLIAREASWRRGGKPCKRSRLHKPIDSPEAPTASSTASGKALSWDHLCDSALPQKMVFIQGSNQMPNGFQIDEWRQTYTTTDSGPTYRLGTAICLLQKVGERYQEQRLTHFEDGYVADCEVSWDASRILFARRGGDHDPWWHIFEMGADGADLVQLTRGPYHDVQPAYLPDGRIVFSSTRIGVRDEYHGYLATGLTIMNADGSNIECIGFNAGRDNEPAILDDGRIVFSRLELFYAYMKTELTLQAAFPDGTKNVTLYGPERRDWWERLNALSGGDWWGEAPPRHRVLRLTQPQAFPGGRILCVSSAGLVVCGPGREHESLVPHDRQLAVTSAFPLNESTVLCAATPKGLREDGTVDEEKINLALYALDVESGEMELLFDAPNHADFEPRPVTPRPRPPVLAESQHEDRACYTARFLCKSATISRESRVTERGRLVRVIEGRPFVVRHRTHNSARTNAWRNHTGTHARVLGTFPMAEDGSFFVEVPADRLIHFQVLDSDRRVVGNQLIWMYGRPAETRSCVGCHEPADSAGPGKGATSPLAARHAPVQCLPTGNEFSYRAKLWDKGSIRDEGEERMRTVQAVNLIARQ